MAEDSATRFDESPVPDYLRFIRLDGRVIIVLGAGQYIGRQTAHALAQAGATVVCVGRGAEATKRIAAEVSGHAFVGDAASRPDVERLFADTHENFGRVDGVVDILGTPVRRNIRDMTDDEWQMSLDNMLRHAFLALQIGAPYLSRNGGGSVVLTSSIAGTAVPRDTSAPGYQVGKAGLNHLAKLGAYEYGREKIRVNAVSLGLIKTPRFEYSDERWWDATRQHYPLRRIGQMSDAACANLFLMSDMAANITGHVLQVDAGLSSTMPSAYAPFEAHHAPPPAGNSAAQGRPE